MEKFSSRYSIIDFAHEILELERENHELRMRLEHHEKMEKIYLEGIKHHDKHNKEFFGIMFGALLDPESALNKGHAALLEKELLKNE